MRHNIEPLRRTDATPRCGRAARDPPAEREPLAEQCLQLVNGCSRRRAQRAVMAVPAHDGPPAIDDIASATTPSMDSAIAALTTRWTRSGRSRRLIATPAQSHAK